MKKIITILTVIVIIIAAFFIKINYKKIKFGNNMSSKTAEEIAQYILDINSYEAQAEITVESNKNTNKYIVNEKCSKEKNVFKKEIVEPENINGVAFTYDGESLKIENTNLNLSKIYENYPYIGESTITLMGFINEYKESDEVKISEKNDEVILENKLKSQNKYISYKKLYVSKTTGKPTKLEIQDITQKTVIYILYSEIKINNLQKDDILAFKLKEISDDI